MSSISRTPPPTGSGSGQRFDASNAQPDVSNDGGPAPTSPQATALIRRSSGAATGDANADLQKLSGDYKNNVEGTAHDTMAAYQGHQISWDDMSAANAAADNSYLTEVQQTLHGASAAEKADLAAAARALWPGAGAAAADKGWPDGLHALDDPSLQMPAQSGAGAAQPPSVNEMRLAATAEEVTKSLPDVAAALPYTAAK